LLQSTHKNPISDASELIGLARQRRRAICNRTGKSPESRLNFQVADNWELWRLGGRWRGVHSQPMTQFCC
jgi:hypothetical protein